MSRHGSRLVVTVFGRTGSGKSTALGRLVQAHIARKRDARVIAIDFLGDMELPFEAERCFSLEEAVKALDGGARAVIVVYPVDDLDGEPSISPAEFLKLALRLSRYLPGAVVVIDELDYPEQVRSGYSPDEVAKLINYSRHWDISLYTAARRPQDVPKALIAQADLIVCGCLATPHELRYMEQYGFDPDRLRELEVGRFLSLNVRTQAVRAVTFKPF